MIYMYTCIIYTCQASANAAHNIILYHKGRNLQVCLPILHCITWIGGMSTHPLLHGGTSSTTLPLVLCTLVCDCWDIMLPARCQLTLLVTNMYISESTQTQTQCYVSNSSNVIGSPPHLIGGLWGWYFHETSWLSPKWQDVLTLWLQRDILQSLSYHVLIERELNYM